MDRFININEYLSDARSDHTNHVITVLQRPIRFSFKVSNQDPTLKLCSLCDRYTITITFLNCFLKNHILFSELILDKTDKNVQLGYEVVRNQ